MVSTRGSRYKFSEGERVLCYEPDPTKAKVLYDSKVLEVTEGKDKRGRRCVEYLIHFQGWNSSWDRAVSEDFVLKDTEENRQLQRDLAEQSQLQIGAYLYRRERKKRSGGSACTTGGSSTGDSSSGAKRARHVDDDADASSGDSTPHHHQGDTETGETVDTDSSSSSQHSVAGPPLIRPIAHPPMIQTNGRTAIVLPTGVRERLTYDYHLVVKRGRLSYLPASPNVCTILESCVREYARIGVWRSPKPAARRGRMSPVQDVRPDINDVSRRLNLMREVAEGIRVYFDFLLNRHLLYRQETEQYHTLVGCFIEKSTAKEEELLQTMAANIVAASEASSSNTRDSSQGPGALHKEAPHTNNTTTHTHSTQPSTSAGLRAHYRIAPKQQLRSKFVRVIPVMRITRQQTDNNNTHATDHRSPAVRFKIERPLDGGKPTSVRYKLRSPKRDRSMEEANVRTGRSESSIVQQMNNQVHYWANGIGEDAEIVENWIERGKPDTDEDETGEVSNNDNFTHNYVGKENTAGKVGDKAAQEDSLGGWVNGEEGESQYGTTGTDIEDEESGSEETETEEDNEEGLDLTVNALDQDDVELVDSDEDWGAGVDMEAEEEAKPIKMEAKFEAQEIEVQKNGQKKQDSNIKKQEEPDTKYIKKEKNNVKAEPSDEIGEEKESIDKIKDTLEVEKDIEIKHRALSPRGKVSGGKDMDKVLKEAAPGTSVGVPDSLARRLRSHKSSVNSTEPCDEKPSTSTGILNSEIPLLKGSSLDSTCSSERCGSSGKPWVRGGLRQEPAVSRGVSGPEPAVTHGGPMDPTMARGPVAKLLEKISSWELLPSVGHEHVPSKVYGAVHLSRLFVRLPDFLNAINIPEAKLKLLLSYISVFVHYLEEHKEFFGDTYYKPDAYSSRSQM